MLVFNNINSYQQDSAMKLSLLSASVQHYKADKIDELAQFNLQFNRTVAEIAALKAYLLNQRQIESLEKQIISLQDTAKNATYIEERSEYWSEPDCWANASVGCKSWCVHDGTRQVRVAKPDYYARNKASQEVLKVRQQRDAVRGQMGRKPARNSIELTESYKALEKIISSLNEELKVIEDHCRIIDKITRQVADQTPFQINAGFYESLVDLYSDLQTIDRTLLLEIIDQLPQVDFMLFATTLIDRYKQPNENILNDEVIFSLVNDLLVNENIENRAYYLLLMTVENTCDLLFKKRIYSNALDADVKKSHLIEDDYILLLDLYVKESKLNEKIKNDLLSLVAKRPNQTKDPAKFQALLDRAAELQYEKKRLRLAKQQEQERLKRLHEEEQRKLVAAQTMQIQKNASRIAKNSAVIAAEQRLFKKLHEENIHKEKHLHDVKAIVDARKQTLKTHLAISTIHEIFAKIVALDGKVSSLGGGEKFILDGKQLFLAKGVGAMLDYYIHAQQGDKALETIAEAMIVACQTIAVKALKRGGGLFFKRDSETQKFYEWVSKLNLEAMFEQEMKPLSHTPSASS